MRLFFIMKEYRKKYNNTFLWIFFIISLFLLTDLFFPFSNSLKSTFLDITSPIQKSMLAAGNNIFPKINITKSDEKIKEEIISLRKENNKLLALLAKTKIIEEENKALRALLDIQEANNHIEIAEVLGREMGNHHLIIRHKNNINIDNAVTTPEGTLIGFVVETHNNISKVRLLTSEESTLEAKIINDNYPIGVLKGDNRNNLYIETLPKNEDIENGNIVVGQSYNGINLNDVYIGRIVNVADHDVDPFLSANVYQGVDLRYINYLFIENK